METREKDMKKISENEKIKQIKRVKEDMEQK